MYGQNLALTVLNAAGVDSVRAGVGTGGGVGDWARHAPLRPLRKHVLLCMYIYIYIDR